MNYEVSIIAAMLHHPREINKHNLRCEDFQDIFLSKVFLSMQALTSRGTDIDFFVISEEMSEKDVVFRLSKIQRDTSFAVNNIPLYVKFLKEVSFKKKVKSQLAKSLEDIDKDDSNSVISDLMTELLSINDGDEEHSHNSKQMVAKALDHVQDAFDRKNDGKLAGVTTGIKLLDQEIGGFHDSDFIVVGARPAMGKTSLMLSCAYAAAKDGYSVGIISTEMSVTQLGVRLMSLSSGIHSSKMRDSNYEDKDWSKMTAGTSILKDLPIYVYDKPSCSVSDIFMQARAWDVEHGLDIIFVDYLTRIRPEGGAENKAIAVGNIATDLKTLARTMNIPVVTLAQLSRGLEKRESKIPNMGDLRDSGVIEQEADQILMLYRECVYDDEASPDKAKIIIEKNRHGATMTLKVMFEPAIMKWGDVNTEEFYR